MQTLKDLQKLITQLSLPVIAFSLFMQTLPFITPNNFLNFAIYLFPIFLLSYLLLIVPYFVRQLLIMKQDHLLHTKNLFWTLGGVMGLIFLSIMFIHFVSFKFAYIPSDVLKQVVFATAVHTAFITVCIAIAIPVIHFYLAKKKFMNV